MLLNARFDDQWRHARTSAQVADIISELMSTLDSDYYPPGVLATGDVAWLCIADECMLMKSPPNGPENHLQISMNRTTGYGGFIWFTPDAQLVFISDNPEPPDFDTRVIAEPGYPLWHDPASTLRLDQVLKVLEEFCYAGTGDRPAGTRWVAGNMVGRRNDRSYSDDE